MSEYILSSFHPVQEKESLAGGNRVACCSHCMLLPKERTKNRTKKFPSRSSSYIHENGKWAGTIPELRRCRNEWSIFSYFSFEKRRSVSLLILKIRRIAEKEEANRLKFSQSVFRVVSNFFVSPHKKGLIQKFPELSGKEHKNHILHICDMSEESNFFPEKRPKGEIGGSI